MGEKPDQCGGEEVGGEGEKEEWEVAGSEEEVVREAWGMCGLWRGEGFGGTSCFTVSPVSQVGVGRDEFHYVV